MVVKLQHSPSLAIQRILALHVTRERKHEALVSKKGGQTTVACSAPTRSCKLLRRQEDGSSCKHRHKVPAVPKHIHDALNRLRICEDDNPASNSQAKWLHRIGKTFVEVFFKRAAKKGRQLEV